MTRPNSYPRIRPPAAAGAFYPADPLQITREIARFGLEPEIDAASWRAALVPHAGWTYSGRIAAAVYQRVVIPDTVVILCPKHRAGGAPWAVAPYGFWSIPGQDIPADMDLARQLAAGVDGLELDATPHALEHAIEVQLPLLAQRANQFRVVGITIGRAALDDCRRLADQMADVLAPRLESVLLVVSSDMNHFATDAENRRLDRLALDALTRLDTNELYEVCTRHQITMCGMRPAVIVLETLRRLDALRHAELVAYGTSADASGDTSRVVGYAGMLFA